MEKAKGIKSRVTVGNITVYDYEPGNGTRYVVQVTDLTGVTSEVRGMMTLINVPTAGSVPLQGHAPHHSYISEKTRLGRADSIALEILLNTHFRPEERTAVDALIERGSI